MSCSWVRAIFTSLSFNYIVGLYMVLRLTKKEERKKVMFTLS